MDLLDSLEVRWFLPDKHPTLGVAQEWFALTKPEANRIDDYLITGRDDLGFKARVVENLPTMIETKYLVGSLGAVEFVPGVVGKLERWRKLSLELDDAKLKKDGTWLSVEKERRLRKYAFNNGLASEVSAKTRPDAGCGIELTKLVCRLDGSADAYVAWTLGLEAFGPDVALLRVLEATCSATHRDGFPLEVDGACSMGYAEWVRSTFNRSQP